MLEIRGLSVEFVRTGWFGRARFSTLAVGDVSLSLQAGETLGIVGESGSGKSTLARAILGLVPPSSGSIRFDGVEVIGARGEPLRRLRRGVQMIFQDPAGSLNPRMRVGDAVAEPLIVHAVCRPSDARRRAAALLEQCGLPAGSDRRYPHEFSGGQRQRVAIARALALSPRIIICDEPTSALDVSVQAQILNLLTDLQRDHALSYLFITHDLAVVRHMAHRILVMKQGRMVESSSRDELFLRPREDYTKALLAAGA